jgi:hypothetical protein
LNTFSHKKPRLALSCYLCGKDYAKDFAISAKSSFNHSRLCLRVPDTTQQQAVETNIPYTHMLVAGFICKQSSVCSPVWCGLCRGLQCQQTSAISTPSQSWRRWQAPKTAQQANVRQQHPLLHKQHLRIELRSTVA